MKKIKFLVIVLGLLCGSVLLNDANASNSIKFGKIEKDNRCKTRVQKKPFIQIIWIYTTCPNGAVRAVGNIGLTDSGGYIAAMYWGEAVACANDQVIHYA